MRPPVAIAVAIALTACTNFTAPGTSPAPPADTQAPTAPTGLAVAARTDTSLTLAWAASADDVAVRSYTVSDAATGAPLDGCTAVPATTCTATGLPDGTTFKLAVRAADAAGNRSSASEILTAVTRKVWAVAKGGNDGAAGTTAAPFRTVQRGVDAARPGDIVVVDDGTYVEQVHVRKSGAAGDWIVLRAKNRWKARLDAGGSAGSYGNAVNLHDSAFIELNGFDVTTPNLSSCVEADGGHHTRVINNDLHDCGGSGVQLNHGDYRFIEGNRIHHNATRSMYAQSGVSLWQSDEFDTAPGFHNIIRGNTIDANENTVPFVSTGTITDGNGIIIDDGRNTQNGSTRGAYAQETLIENNLIYDNGGKGVQIYLSDHVTIRNNTVYWNNRHEDGTWRGEINLSASSNVTVVNNIIVTNPAYDANNTAILNGTYGSNAANTLKYRNNITFNGTPGQAAVRNSGVTADIDDSNQLGVNPKLADPRADGTGDFRLLDGSPAVDAGSSALGAPATDLDGLNRPRGNAVDIGAFER